MRVFLKGVICAVFSSQDFHNHTQNTGYATLSCSFSNGYEKAELVTLCGGALCGRDN